MTVKNADLKDVVADDSPGAVSLRGDVDDAPRLDTKYCQAYLRNNL